jgi:hypothetical protein
MQRPERRHYHRLTQPLEGSFRGHSGAGPARVADIGWGGCFVESVAAPVVGDQTIVTVQVNGRRLDLPGRVLYVDAGMGFGFVFSDLEEEQIEGLQQVLGPAPASLKAASLTSTMKK